MVSPCESDDSAFGDRTVGQLKSELQRLKKQESDLLEMFPEFDEYRSQEPASPEEAVEVCDDDPSNFGMGESSKHFREFRI